VISLVVDASVAVKWFVPEVHGIAAQRLIDPRHQLFAPDLLWPEFGNILWKKQLRRQISPQAARRILIDFRSYRVGIFPSEPLVVAALEIAQRIGRTVYDSLYLALAERLRCRVVTADEKLFNAVQGDAISSHMLWVEDRP